MSSDNNQNTPSSGRKKRSYKDLPIELHDISPKDITSITCAVEIDKTTDKEILMAQRIVRGDTTIELSSLNVDQLRLLCRRLGITGSSSSKRAACRHMIALCHNINENAAKRTDDPRSVEQQATNTLLRQVNMIFSSEFVQRFEELNDGKTRADHETGNIAKKFWIDITLAYNDIDIEDSNLSEQSEHVHVNDDLAPLTRQDDFWKDPN